MKLGLATLINNNLIKLGKKYLIESSYILVMNLFGTAENSFQKMDRCSLTARYALILNSEAEECNPFHQL